MWNPLIWILLFGFCSTQAVPIEEKAQRDSYGKLIQAKNTIDGKKIAQTDDGIEFEVPSYASGIVVPEPYNDLLPPLTSSEKIEAGSADSDIIYIESLGGSSNNIRDGKSIGNYQKENADVSATNLPTSGKTAVTIEESIEVPYTDLNPPYYDNEKPYSTDTPELIGADGNIKHIEKPIYDRDVYKGGFGGPSGILGNQKSIGTYHQQKNVAKDINSGLTDSIPPLVKSSDESLYDGDIYKGGFGGTSGVLGNQKSIGTYHQQKDTVTDINFELTSLIPTRTAAAGKNTKNSNDLLYDGDIYKGGFGGTSGILGNQESIGTYHQMKTGITNIESVTSNPIYKSQTNLAVTNFITPLESSTKPSTDNSLYNGDIYKGGFGGPSGFLGEQSLPGIFYQNQNNEKVNKIVVENKTENIQVIQSSTKPSTDNSLYNGDIYKGGFGGPSGFLGEQSLPGTFYQNQNNEKVNKIVEENKTENIKITHTTARPKKKIVSRFEFSSLQKPDSNTNIKKHEEKKTVSISDGINKGGKSGKIATFNQNKTYNTNPRIQTPNAVLPPSGDLLPPFEDDNSAKLESDKSSEKSIYDGDIYKNGGPSGILESEKIAEQHQDKTTIDPNVTDITEEITTENKIIQNYETTTEIYNLIESTAKTYEFKTEIIPINFKNEAVTPPTTDLIPPIVDSAAVQEISTANPITEEIKEIPSPILKKTIFENNFIRPVTDLNSASVSTEKIITYNEAYKNIDSSTPLTNLNSASVSTKRVIVNDRAEYNTEKSLYEGDIYKGGFGGPSGFLGEQLSIGTYHQQINLENKNEAKIGATTEHTTTHSKNVQNTNTVLPISSNIRNTKSPIISDIPLIRVALNNDAPAPEVNTKSFLSSPITTPTLSLQSTTPEPPSIFFTPPFFSPKPEQEQKLLIQKGNVPSYSQFSEQSSPEFGQRFNNNGQTDFLFPNTGSSFPKTPQPQQPQEFNTVPNTFNVPSGLQNQQIFSSPVIPVRIDNQKEATTPLNSFNNLDAVVTPINLNAFGNIQGFKSPQFFSSIGTLSNNKFTGSFGGAPGVLGNQKQPGYGIQQQNVVTPPHFEPVTAAVVISNNKYNGGFGGPPGILSPFDNKSK